MDYSVLKKVMEYGDLYESVAQGVESVEELISTLKRNGVIAGPLQRRADYLSGEPPYLSIEGDSISYDAVSLNRDLRKLADNLIPSDYRDETKHAAEKLQLKEQVSKLESENEKLVKEMSEKEKLISELRAELLARSAEMVKTELERKVIVASSISVGPQESIMDDCFLVDPNRLLDVDACVARYGGELDSFYKEIPTDEKNTGFEPGHELTERNHALRTMKTVGTKRFFLKRIKDNAEAKETEKRVGQLFPGHGDGKTEWQKERDKILHNRFMSLNNILKCDRLTNQEKLMMYAMNTEYHNTHIERLLNYAGSHCINANYVIELLEDPDICTTYENTIDFLNQFANPSEFRMKLNLARELIEGKWYITADYNGKETKFQLVPIDEINELRKAVGLPISEFVYKGKKTKKFGRKNEDAEEEEENLKKPDFVEDVSADSYGDIDIPDDDFEMPDLDDDDTSL